jgi:hypothetical protein
MPGNDQQDPRIQESQRRIDGLLEKMQLAFNGEPVTMGRRELYEIALRTQCATQDRISELTEQLETSERMRHVADGHVSSLETHLRAIHRTVGKQGITSCKLCERVRGILDGSVNIFANEAT